MMSYKAVPLEIDDERWLNLVRMDTGAVFFHHPQWIRLVSESYHYKALVLGALDDGGNLAAGIPLVQVKTMTQKPKWISLPFTDHCAPLGSSEEAKASLTGYCQALCKQKKGFSVELRWDYGAGSGTKKDIDFYLHRLPLAKDEDEVARRILPKDFRQIKVAYERGVRVEMGTSLEQVKAFYGMHVLTRRRKGVPVQPWHFFERLQQEILSAGFGFVVLAFSGKECVAGAIFLNSNQTLIYKYSASNDLARPLLAMDPILWTAICWGCEHEDLVLDMGRTEVSNTGLAKFKERWGASRMPLVYTRFGAVSQNAGTSRLMPLIESVLRRSPTWATKLAGEIFYRYSN